MAAFRHTFLQTVLPLLVERGRYRVTVTSPVRACVLTEQGKSLHPHRLKYRRGFSYLCTAYVQPPELSRGPDDCDPESLQFPA